VAVNPARYEQFGWDYERFNPLTDEEIAWYVGFARSAGGPVLELACGTGRLLVAIAGAGLQIEGIDLSPRMLGMARERIRQSPSEVASRVLVHQADMTSFRLGRSFGLVLLADNSFGELTTPEEQLSCLKCASRHLRPDGRLLVTVRRFDASVFRNGQTQSEWSEPMHHPETGDLVRRRTTTDLVQAGKRVRTTIFYGTVHEDGTETTQKYFWEAPVMSTADYISLFSQAGFRTEVSAGYEERPDDGESPVLCFVCEKGYRS